MEAVVCPTVTDVSELTLSDFYENRVFAYLCSIKDPFEQALEKNKIAERAREIGFKNFVKLFTLYQNKQRTNVQSVAAEDNVTEFDGQPVELDCGEWRTEELGVWRPRGNIQEIACSHPIMPMARMRSIDTGTIKYHVIYRRGTKTGKNADKWDSVDIDAADMASPTEIVKKLAPKGVSISGGDRAKSLVEYLRDICDLNYDRMQEVRCVSRMGWNEEGFAPYDDGVAYDGTTAFMAAYNAIREQGAYDTWLDEAIRCRAYSTATRIVLAASFAAPLVEPLGVLPFFVHVWSFGSGTGKTVALMLGASVWADPTAGGAFFQTFRSTSVGVEMMAGFLHSMPLFLDELQLAKDHHGRVLFNVYELASGSGKLRSNKSLGLNYTPKWNMCFITSGETPLVSETDGEGALNRVIEIECDASQKLIEDGHKTANLLKANYGFAGKLFVQKLMEDGMLDKVREVYDGFFVQCSGSDATEKQAMAAAAILTADHFATEWIFHDGKALTAEEVGAFLKERNSVSMVERAYNLLCDWIVVNTSRFQGIRDGDKGECYGLVEDGKAYIIRSVFDSFCADHAVNAKGFLSNLRSKNLLESRDKRYVVNKRIGGSSVVSCVCVRMPDQTEQKEIMPTEATAPGVFQSIIGEDDELPF